MIEDKECDRFVYKTELLVTRSVTTNDGFALN